MSDEDRRLLALLGLGLVIGIGIDQGLKLVGVHVTAATYVAGPNPSQATATVAVHNYTDSATSYILQGYMVRSDVLASLAPAPLGLGLLESNVNRYNKIAGTHAFAGTPGVSYPNGLFAGHWFVQPNIAAAGAGAVDPTLAQQERNIPVTVARGHVASVQAYSATPLISPPPSVKTALRNFWLVLAAAGGAPLSVYLDPKPIMPAVGVS